MAVGQHQWDLILGFSVNSPPIVEPILVGIESDVHWGYGVFCEGTLCFLWFHWETTRTAMGFLFGDTPTSPMCLTSFSAFGSEQFLRGDVGGHLRNPVCLLFVLVGKTK